MYREVPFATLIGLTLIDIQGMDKNSTEILFVTDTGRKFKMYHRQDCCEYVHVEDVNGDVEDLLHTTMFVADESSSNENPPNTPYDILEYQDSFTWTFYRLSTAKGWVTLRWYGSSNGYYSEHVTFEEITEDGGHV